MIERGPADDAATTAAAPLWRRLVWFVALWAAGVLVVGVAAYIIRLALRP